MTFMMCHSLMSKHGTEAQLKHWVLLSRFMQKHSRMQPVRAIIRSRDRLDGSLDAQQSFSISFMTFQRGEADRTSHASPSHVP
jgi:hypothetical protein